MNKSFRLSKGFWHKFLPNSNKLFSPQNIPIEIWDIDKRTKESKWNPGIYGIENLTVSNKGDKFVILGGWITSRPNRSEFKIYKTDTFNCVDEFSIMEKCTNPKFTHDDKNLIFGTWEGILYRYSLEEKKLTKQFAWDNHMFELTHHGKLDNQLYAAVTRQSSEHNDNPFSFVFEYDVVEKTGNPVYFHGNGDTRKSDSQTVKWSVCGLALHKEKLAVLLASYGGKEDNNVIHHAKAFIYNVKTKEITLLKQGFKIRDVFDDYGSIVWNHRGNKLAFIGLHEIHVIDMENHDEMTIPFERATSVEFSNCDTGIAVGGEKAKIFKVE